MTRGEGEALARLLAEGTAARAGGVGADALRAEEVAERLGVRGQEVEDLRRDGKLLAVLEGRVLWFPAWQIVDGAVLPGLERVIGELRRVPAIMAVQFFQAPREELEGRTPVAVLAGVVGLPDHLRAGAVETVARAARLFGEQAGG